MLSIITSCEVLTTREIPTVKRDETIIEINFIRYFEVISLHRTCCHFVFSLTWLLWNNSRIISYRRILAQKESASLSRCQKLIMLLQNHAWLSDHIVNRTDNPKSSQKIFSPGYFSQVTKMVAKTVSKKVGLDSLCNSRNQRNYISLTLSTIRSEDRFYCSIIKIFGFRSEASMLKNNILKQ